MFENQPKIGGGIYTTSQISEILGLPYYKVHRWINKYWDKDLGEFYRRKYSWSVNNSRAVSFHTLIEFYVMMQFLEAGVKTKEILRAHKELSTFYGTEFPFAQNKVLQSIRTDKSKIFLEHNGYTISLDGTKQLNMNIIRLFIGKLDFDNELLAARFWPLGKNKKVVCDPDHAFGQPVIEGTNIQTEALYSMFKAKEPIPFIATLYELPESSVRDAIRFHEKAA